MFESRFRTLAVIPVSDFFLSVTYASCYSVNIRVSGHKPDRSSMTPWDVLTMMITHYHFQRRKLLTVCGTLLFAFTAAVLPSHVVS